MCAVHFGNRASCEKKKRAALLCFGVFKLRKEGARASAASRGWPTDAALAFNNADTLADREKHLPFLIRHLEVA